MDKIDSVISETAQSITRLPRPRLHYGLLVQHQQPFHWPDQLRPRYRYIHIDVQCDIDLLSHSPSLTGGMRTFSRLRWLEPSHLQWAPITAGDLRYPWGHHVCPIWKLGVVCGSGNSITLRSTSCIIVSNQKHAAQFLQLSLKELLDKIIIVFFRLLMFCLAWNWNLEHWVSTHTHRHTTSFFWGGWRWRSVCLPSSVGLYSAVVWT